MSSTKRAQIPDTMLMYASLFTYEPDQRKNMITYEVNYDRIQQYEVSSASLPKGSCHTLRAFMEMDPEQQREYVDNREKSIPLYHVLFAIIQNIKQDFDLTYFCLTLINGILEDKRSRVSTLQLLQKSNNPDRKLDCI